MNSRNLIILFGKPGSGKSTIGRQLSKKINFNLINIGDVLRQYITVSQGNLKERISISIEKGSPLLISDLKRVLSFKKTKVLMESSKGLIIDGLPRDDIQFENITNLIPNFDKYNRRIALYIDSNNEYIYYINKNEERFDHKSSILKLRIENFEKKILPLIYKYENSYEIIYVKNDSTIQDCIEKILSSISIDNR